MKNKQYDFRTAYIDLLLNVLTGIVFLFMITTLLITTKAKQADEGVKKNAEYIITAHWSPDLDCDVDLWGRDPAGNIVSFKSKDVGLMHLERDDLGYFNDLVVVGGQVFRARDNINEETIVLRGRMAGRFTINLHLYGCKVDNIRSMIGDARSVEVTVELIRLNPSYQRLASQTVTLERIWHELTAFNFNLDDQGRLTGDVDREQYQLIKRE